MSNEAVVAPNLLHIVQGSQAEQDPALAGMIDQETAVTTLVDGIVGGLLECLGMAHVVKLAEHASQQTEPDHGKIRLARVKMVEGMLELIEASGTRDLIDDQYSEDGGVSPVTLLEEFISLYQPQAEEVPNEQSV
jgi:hypothetical protein